VSIDQFQERLDALTTRPAPAASEEAAAARYIRRHAIDEQDAQLLLDAILGPLTTRPGGRQARRLATRGAA
jgi:hypothetical protein